MDSNVLNLPLNQRKNRKMDQALIDTAGQLNGGSDGYTFAIVLLTVLLIVASIVIRSLYLQNKDLQNAAVLRVEGQTKALIEALHAVKENYGRLSELVIEIKSKLP
jgi:hypothetical protein